MSQVITEKPQAEALHASPDVLMGRKQRVEGVVRREMPTERLDVAIVDEEARTVRVSFSSEEPYLRRTFWEDPWIEVLGHDASEVDLFRLQNRATVHYNHWRTREDRIGVVLEASVKNGRGEALIQISDRDDVSDIWNDLSKGMLCNISVAYNINERVLTKQNEDGPDEYRVTSWEPVEISIVDIPADPTVGVGRNDGVDHHYRVIDLETAPDESGSNPEDKTMSTKKTGDEPTGGDPNKPAGDDVLSKSEADDQAKKAAATARDEALREDATRVSEITECFRVHEDVDGVRDLMVECITKKDCSVESARQQLLDHIGKNKKPSGVGHFQPGDDAADKFRDMVVNNLSARARLKDDDGKPITADPQNTVRGYSLPELARACLSFANLDTSGSRLEMIGRALTMRQSGIGLTPSDFPSILQNIAGKAALLGFAEANETWMRWCRVGNLSDFKQASRVGLSQFEGLELVAAGGEYKYGKFTDKGETITLASYGKIFPIARQTIINDDLSMLMRAPELMGRAAARVPGDLAYAALTSNPLMGEDGVALFDATHGNIGTSGVISVASVGEARELMALQTDISNNANGLNIALGYLLVPVQLEDVANTLRTSEFDPDATGNTRAPNPRRNTFEVVGDARLSADSAVQWYAAAAQGFDTVEVAFLDGIQEPRIEEKAGWTVDGAEFKVALDVAASPMEYRTFVRNAGV